MECESKFPSIQAFFPQNCQFIGQYVMIKNLPGFIWPILFDLK